MLIGEDAETILSELGKLAPSVSASDLGEAVRFSFAAAEAGDIVLLAPACASFDMFESFEHRGRIFKQEVSSFEFRVSSTEREPGTRNSKLET